MAEAMGLVDHSIEGFITAIERILDQLDIPRSLAELGVPLDAAPRLAAKAILDSAASTNPRSASVDEVLGSFTAAQAFVTVTCRLAKGPPSGLVRRR